MAQYDVYVNPSSGSRQRLPFVVDVQSNMLADLATRQVIPLAAGQLNAHDAPRRLSPAFTVAGQQVWLLPHLTAPLHQRLLRQPVGSLAGHEGEVRDALDAVVSGL